MKGPNPQRWTPQAWRGVAALIIAFGLSATVVLLAIETILHSGSISTQESSLLSTALGAMVGAVAVFLGGHTTDGGGSVASDEPAPPTSDALAAAPRSESGPAGPET